MLWIASTMVIFQASLLIAISQFDRNVSSIIQALYICFMSRTYTLHPWRRHRAASRQVSLVTDTRRRHVDVTLRIWQAVAEHPLAGRLLQLLLLHLVRYHIISVPDMSICPSVSLSLCLSLCLLLTGTACFYVSTLSQSTVVVQQVIEQIHNLNKSM